MIRRDVDSLTPGRDFSRRDIVQAAVGSGGGGWKRCLAWFKANGVA